MAKNFLHNRIAAMTTKELIDIVYHHPDDYTREARDAAEAELADRQVKASDFSERHIPQHVESPRERPVGIGGLLLVLGMILVFGIVSRGVSAIDYFRIGSGDMILLAGMKVIFASWALYVTILLLIKDHRFRDAAIVYFAVTAGVETAVDFLVDSSKPSVGGLTVSMLAISYLVSSRRVRSTFGENTVMDANTLYCAACGECLELDQQDIRLGRYRCPSCSREFRLPG